MFHCEAKLKAIIFPRQMKYLNLFFQWYAKNRNEKSLFFIEISLEYEATKLPQDCMERGKSQTSLTETLN